MKRSSRDTCRQPLRKTTTFGLRADIHLGLQKKEPGALTDQQYNGPFDSAKKTTTGVGRDSSIGMATRYVLDDPGIESRWGQDFPLPSRPALWPT